MSDKCKVCKNREEMCKDSVAMRNLCKRNGFDAFSPVTNADKYFRNATDEEIASFLAAVNNHRQWSEQTLMQDLDADYAYYLDWLKQEAESDG